jgi:hypothetical protein
MIRALTDLGYSDSTQNPHVRALADLRRFEPEGA